MVINKNGFELRALRCDKCGEQIIHPADLNASEHFKDLKGKNFHVKLRMVGNSHAISIPKEIVNFINEMHRDMTREMDMVRLQFEDFGRLSVHFDDFFDVKMPETNPALKGVEHLEHPEVSSKPTLLSVDKTKRLLDNPKKVIDGDRSWR